MSQKTYSIIIKVNGDTLEALPGAQITFGGFTREPLMVNGKAGRHHIKKPVHGSCSFKLAHGPEVDIDAIRAWEEVTLVAECDSGVTYQMAGAYTTNALELADGDGGLSVEMAGPAWQVV
jgi:hypothetical protein